MDVPRVDSFLCALASMGGRTEQWEASMHVLSDWSAGLTFGLVPMRQVTALG